MTFTEPLNRRLSSIEVVDRSGRDIGQGSTTAVPGDDRGMQRKLGFLRPGFFTVRWTTVSKLDGHTLRGSYRFGIGDAPLGDEQVASSPVSSEGWAGLLGRFVALAGLSLWVGFIVVGGVSSAAGPTSERKRWLALAGPILALAGTGLWALSAARVSSGSITRVGDVLLGSGSGEWRLVLLAAAAVGVALWGRWRVLGGLAAAVAVVSEAASGHAAATSRPVLATAVLAVHLVAVGVWVYAIVAAVLSSERLLTALARFSPWAIGAAIAVGLTGVVNALFELASPDDLISTGYGKAVTFKGLAFVAMAAFGFVHYSGRRRRRASFSVVEGAVRSELLFAVVALAVTATLVGFPNPPREAEAAEHLTTTDPVLADLAHRDALTLGGASGPFVAGLTLLPPRPGDVEFRLQVIGVEAGDALRDAQARGTGPDGAALTAPLSPCGLGCFAGHGRVDATGTWQLNASVISNRGQINLDFTVPLPTPDGTSLLRRTIDSMGQLQTLRMHEDLRSVATGAPFASEYTYRAPDTLDFRTDKTTTITIGKTSYMQSAPGAAWKTEEDAGTGFTWPYYRAIWGHAVTARIIGEETIDDAPSFVLTFFRPDVTAWFRIWVGQSDGLVRREEMRAEGHIMDHTYGPFDQPVDISPPAG